ncbi:MAG TPA: hypothetical protein PK066_21800, partial [Saprospiraceae bacterium]|nr:hypothetical protein [Saprospiraceae bacterium]
MNQFIKPRFNTPLFYYPRIPDFRSTSRLLSSLVFILFFSIIALPLANATHFRYGSITWQQTGAPY